MSQKHTVEEPIVIHPRVLDGDRDEAYHGAAGSTATAAAAAAAPAQPAPPDPLASANEAMLSAGPVAHEAAAARPTKRALSLDALRGFFMLVITMGFTIQERIFPAWMYHRQNPPPTHDFVELAGLTWRDLAFPVFLFSMAAALPIVFMRRIERGEPAASIVSAAFKRGFMLYVFAVLIGHSNAFFIGSYNQTSWILGLIGFAIMFAAFTRRKSDWNEARYKVIRTAGWIAAAVFLALSPLLYDSTFQLGRRDGIIAMIAFSSIVGALIWYLTRANLPARMGALAFVLALSIGALDQGWLNSVWWSSPVPALFEPGWLTLLIVVIPGTIAGDFLVRWMRTPEPERPAERAWRGDRLAALAILGVLFLPVLVVGMYNRWVLGTTQLIIGLCALGFVLSHRPTRPGEDLVRQLWVWGSLLLVFGMLMEPFQGGMKKVPGTLSYYFAMAGASFLLLTSFVIVVDLLKRRRLVQPLIDVGQNPMIAYIAYSVFITSVLGLIPGSWQVLRGSPAQSIVRSFIMVLLVVFFVRALTRRRIFWRT